ncbi:MULTISPECIES: hypothetical protein [unclassified Spirosoma]|uniref:hypothetical protein n=1 Tax=unclassified Spirosoma TaxID=2621999 RepID=UPI00095DE3D1|nr:MULTISPECIES: hypothetical protein [unclassified Spirosoma]MBN8823366.1 hypothetical protein [Spirosoma sp.]OJW72497.1 MAG: hypothetical protein BGO59_15335 [Spirosoma sp. 48-14]
MAWRVFIGSPKREHIAQANRNLDFLEQANQSLNPFWDWQVTAAFYVGVHLINAHLAQKSGLSFRSHQQVDEAINPFNQLSLTKLSETNYLAYDKLQGLARRARYLCNEDRANKVASAHFTYDKHFARAIRNMDILISFIEKEYNVTLKRIAVKCIELKKGSLQNIAIR